MFGNPETTPGGRALKFYASVRLDIRRIETIKNGTYQPLSRPLFIYAHGKSLDRQVVKDFLRFGLSAHGTELVSRTGYVGLSPSELAIEAAKVPG